MGFGKQADLANAIGTDRTRVSRWESGESLPDSEYKASLLRVLRLTESELFDIPSEEPAPPIDLAAARAKLDVLDMLTKFAALSQAHQKIVQAVIYDDPGFVVSIKPTDWPKWLPRPASLLRR